MIDTHEYIDLQSANVQQNTTDGIKTNWIVKKNISGEKLGEFPNTIPDDVMFQILDFSRKYELIAFNAGIAFQKGKQNKVLKEQIEILKKANAELANENERLSGILEEIIGET